MGQPNKNSPWRALWPQPKEAFTTEITEAFSVFSVPSVVRFALRAATKVEFSVTSVLRSVSTWRSLWPQPNRRPRRPLCLEASQHGAHGDSAASVLEAFGAQRVRRWRGRRGDSEIHALAGSPKGRLGNETAIKRWFEAQSVVRSKPSARGPV